MRREAEWAVRTKAAWAVCMELAWAVRMELAWAVRMAGIAVAGKMRATGILAVDTLVAAEAPRKAATAWVEAAAASVATRAAADTCVAAAAAAAAPGPSRRPAGCNTHRERHCGDV